ncbi:MAG: aldo/keto reductase [Rubrivivax sp.]
MDRRREDLVRAARRLRRRRLQPDRHHRCLLALGAGHTGGEGETIIGKWLKAGAASSRRDRILIATKVGKPMGADGSGRMGLSRRWIRQAVHESLQRLQTDRIDLYQSHDDDTATPFEKTLAAFAELIAEEQVRHRRQQLQRRAPG